MENRPHIIISGLSVPPDVEDRYFKWFDEVYNPAYVKMDTSTIDRYQIIKKSFEYPGYASIRHRANKKAAEEVRNNPARLDIQKATDTTFHTIEYFWHDVYVLMGSFRNDSSSRESSLVDNTPIIHLEGYRVVPGDRENEKPIKIISRR